MANKKNVHENSEPVIEDRPYCGGRVEKWSAKKERMVSRKCKLQSTLLGDEHGEPACQWHGGRPDPEKQAKPRSDSIRALSSRPASQGGVSVMGDTLNSTFSSRWSDLCAGRLSVQDLDTEELARGMVRDADGIIRGHATKMVPRSLAQEMKAELFARANASLEQDLVAAAEVLGDIARNEDVEPQHRIKAASLIIERVMGKNPETLRIQQEKPYEQIMTQILRKPPDVIEAEYTVIAEEKDDDRY